MSDPTGREMASVAAVGETVEFPVNGDAAGGYLVRPEAGGGPGVIVIQEWWGLVPQIKGVCDGLGAEGFVALAPDLFHGDIAEHHEMDKAGRLMSELPPERAARDMSAAVDYLLGLDRVRGSAVGVVGFCMGGLLSLVLAANEGDRIAAAAPFYGAPLGDAAPDWAGLTAPVLGHFAERDDFFPPAAITELESDLKSRGKDVTFTIYPDTGHGFANELNPLGSHHPDAATRAWAATITFLHDRLG